MLMVLDIKKAAIDESVYVNEIERMPYKLQPEIILFYLLFLPPFDELLDPELLLLEGEGEE